MDPPPELRAAADQDDDVVITRREYEGETVLAVDFGPEVEATLDVVGDAAIVVAGDRQIEFQLPADVAEITTNDGIVLLRE